MTSQLIGTTETGWFNPAVNPPPFDMKLLLMVAGSRSEDCGRTFEPYTVVMTAYVQQQGPGDEYDDETAFDEYMSGDQTDFLDFQFDLKDEDGEVLDWYSDSIVAWAYYPLGIAQTAVNVERERQVALVPNPHTSRAQRGTPPHTGATMSLRVFTNGQIQLDNHPVALWVTQGRHGTIVYTPADKLVPGGKRTEHPMPHQRYTLAHDTSDKPNVAGCLQFEADIRALLARLES